MMKLLRGVFVIAAVIGIVCASDVSAQTPDEQWVRCSGDEPDLSIGACTAIIQSGQAPTRTLAAAFANRGTSRNRKGQHDQAIQDFTQAIALNPALVEAFNGRGNAYDDQGQHGLALRDYDEAIRLDITYGVAYFNRGLVHQRLGRYDQAIADFRSSHVGQRPCVRCSLESGRTYLLSYDESVSSDHYPYYKAKVDFEDILLKEPRHPGALYGRGLAKQRLGDLTGGAADLAAAELLQPDVDVEFKNLGLLPLGGPPGR